MPAPDLSYLREDPEFAALSYQDQVYVRSQLLQEPLQNDPQFRALSAHDQSYVYRQLLYEMPAFEDDASRAVTEHMRKRLSSDDPQERRAALRDVGRLSLLSGYESSGLIGNLAARIAPALFEGAEYDLTGLDKDKMMQYLASYQFDDPKVREQVENAVSNGASVGAFAGLTSDIVAWHSTLGGVLSRGLASGARALMPSLGRTGSTVATAFAESISEGVFGTFIRDAALYRLNGETPLLQRPASEIAKNFGFWVGEDILWSLGANTILPFFGNVGRTFLRDSIFKKTDLGLNNLTKAEYDDMAKYVRGGEELPEIYTRLSQETQTLIDSARQLHALDLTKGVDDAARMHLMGLRYGLSVDFKQIGDGVEIRVFDPLESSLYKFNSIDDAYTGIAKKIGPEQLMARTVDADISKLKSRIATGTGTPEPGELLTRQIWDEQIEAPFRQRLGVAKVEEPEVKKVRKPQPEAVPVGGRSGSPEAPFEQRVRPLTDRAPRTDYEGPIEPNVEVVKRGEDITTRKKYAEDIARRNNMAISQSSDRSGWTIRNAEGRTIDQAPTISKAVDRMYLHSLDIDRMAKLLRADGYNVRVRNGELFTKDAMGNRVRGTDPVRIADDMGWQPKELPPSFAPAEYQVKPKTERLLITDGGHVEGPRDLILQSQAKFSDPTDGRALVDQTADYSILEFPDGYARLEIPRSGIKLDFESLDAARKWARRYPTSVKLYKEVATRKGLEVLSAGKDGFRVTDGTRTFTAQTRDQAEAILRRFPDAQDGAREFVSEFTRDFDQDMANAQRYIREQTGWSERQMYNFLNERATKVLDEAKIGAMAEEIPHEYWEQLKPADWGQGRRLLSNTQRFFEVTFKKMGDTRGVKLYRQFQENLRYAEAEMTRLHGMLDDILRGPDGNLVSPEVRAKLMHHGQAVTPDDFARVREVYGELTGEESQMLARIKRDIYGHLANRFGIPFDKFVQEYLPRIRRALEANLDSVGDMRLATDLLDRMPDMQIPKELRVWFENDRIHDILTIAIDDDIYSATLKYINQGMKKSYLNQYWKEIHNHLGELKARGLVDSDSALISKFDAYRQQVMGYYHPKWQQMAESLGEKFAAWRWDNLKPSKKAGLTRDAYIAQGRQLYNKFFELNYLTNMGFKPYLPIRNMTQIYTMLAPRVTNNSVDRAVKYLLENEEAAYSYLKRIGVINEKAPTINIDNPTAGRLGRITEKSLVWFKNSDQFTRAIAFFSAKQNMDEAISMLKDRKITSKAQFFDIASLEFTAPDIRENIWKMVNEGVTKGDQAILEGAVQLHGAQMAQDTMFLYRQYQSPELFKETLMGKMFGQYGTYAAGYVQSVTGAWRAAPTPAAKAAYMGRFLLNHGALFALTTAIGIRADNYIPFAPMMFTGGPFFDIAINLVKSFDLGYGGAEARSELLRAVTQMYPGSAQVRMLRKAAEFANQGETYKAWLSLTAAPVNTRAPFGAR